MRRYRAIIQIIIFGKVSSDSSREIIELLDASRLLTRTQNTLQIYENIFCFVCVVDISNSIDAQIKKLCTVHGNLIKNNIVFK